MATRYSAFLVRHWFLASGQERIEVLHIASGAQHRCASLAEAAAWLQGQARAPTGGSPVGSADRADEQEGATGRRAGRIDGG